MGETAFGRYLRTMRNAADLSLRDVAEALGGISHVYLGEVERGVRPPMKPEWWPKLAKAIPKVTVEELANRASESKPVQLRLEDAPPQYRELGLALARRIEDQDLSSADLNRLIDLLKGGKRDG